MTEKKFPYISSLGIMIERNQKDIQTAQDEENKISKIVEIPIDTFSRERPSPRLHVSFPPAGTSLKFNISPAGTPARPDRHPPSLPSPFEWVPSADGDGAWLPWRFFCLTGGCSHHQPPSPSTLHLLQTRLFCLPLVRRTNRAQRKNIQSRVKNSRVVVVVVVVASVVVSNGCWLVAERHSGSGGAHRIESPSENPPVFTPHPILLCSTVTRDEGRWRWRSNRPCLQRNHATPLPQLPSTME